MLPAGDVLTHISLDPERLSATFDKDPAAAKATLCLESGLGRFPWADELDPSMVTAEDTPDAYRRGLQDMQAEAETPEKQELLLKAAKLMLDDEGELLTCAGCGVYSFEKLIYTPLSDLAVLRIAPNSEDYTTYYGRPEAVRAAASVYCRETTNGRQLYHLHPEFVCMRPTHAETPAEPPRAPINRYRKTRRAHRKPPRQAPRAGEQEHAPLCILCTEGLKKGKDGLNPHSLAAGLDYGCPDRLRRSAFPDLLPLRPAERALIARVRVYQTVYKLTDSAYNYSVMKGHSITFVHNGATIAYKLFGLSDQSHAHVQVLKWQRQNSICPTLTQRWTPCMFSSCPQTRISVNACAWQCSAAQCRRLLCEQTLCMPGSVSFRVHIQRTRTLSSTTRAKRGIV